MPEVTICTVLVVMPTLGGGIVFKRERLDYPAEYRIEHLLVCFALLIQPLLGNMPILDLHGQ
jgi:hypothetical protein